MNAERISKIAGDIEIKNVLIMLFILIYLFGAIGDHTIIMWW